MSVSIATAGHHEVDPGAVLAAVQTPVLRPDRSAAAGLDAAARGARVRPLRDGRAYTRKQRQ